MTKHQAFINEIAKVKVTSLEINITSKTFNKLWLFK